MQQLSLFDHPILDRVVGMREFLWTQSLSPICFSCIGKVHNGYLEFLESVNRPKVLASSEESCGRCDQLMI